MKLVTYRPQANARPRLGAVLGDQILDLAGAAARRGDKRRLPASVRGLLMAGESTWARARELLAEAATRPAWLDLALLTPLTSAHLAAPIPNPSKALAIGLNYLGHCREQNRPVPKAPLIFAKNVSAIIGPYAPIRWTAGLTAQVDYEAELAFVIGKTACRVSEDQAMSYVFGYMVANDVSARDLQFGDGQWTRGKGLDTFFPTGPFLVSQDEVPDPHNLTIRAWVNGELRQDSTTADLIFKIPALVAYISRAFTLYPGDIVITGTPGGVGVFRQPPVFLQAGDVVEVEVERLGRLVNPVGGAVE